MKLLHFLLLLLPFLSAVVVGRQSEKIVGGWSPIGNLNDPHVIDIAKYAVSEYDKRSGAKLQFEKVLKGESQVVAGTNYRLVLATKDGSATKNYEAVVWEKAWQHFMNLTSFKPVH